MYYEFIEIMQIEVPQCKWKIKQLHQHNIVFLIVAEETKKRPENKRAQIQLYSKPKIIEIRQELVEKKLIEYHKGK